MVILHGSEGAYCKSRCTEINQRHPSVCSALLPSNGSTKDDISGQACGSLEMYLSPHLRLGRPDDHAGMRGMNTKVICRYQMLGAARLSLVLAHVGREGA